MLRNTVGEIKWVESAAERADDDGVEQEGVGEMGMQMSEQNSARSRRSDRSSRSRGDNGCISFLWTSKLNQLRMIPFDSLEDQTEASLGELTRIAIAARSRC